MTGKTLTNFLSSTDNVIECNSGKTALGTSLLVRLTDQLTDCQQTQTGWKI